MTNHPTTPPPELVQQWCSAALGAKDWLGGYDLELIATQAARWGADQELEACCEWLSVPCPSYGRELRTARRPKPPSLAKEAHDALGRFFSNAHTQASQMTQDFEILRHAVQRLQELENNG